MHPILQRLAHSGLIWRGRVGGGQRLTLSTGYPELDAILPGGGWPCGALVEVCLPCDGIGEIQLFLPSLVALSARRRWLLWAQAPYIPYAPTLVNAGINLEYLWILRLRRGDPNLLWAVEKALRTEACGMVLLWPQRLTATAVRRLQLAAETGGSIGVFFHSRRETKVPAALRLELQSTSRGLQVQVCKARGASQGGTVYLKLAP